MKEDQNTNELRQIRRALLQAAKEDYLEALKDAPEAPPFSKNHRRWERRFLKDPFSLRTPIAHFGSAACAPRPASFSSLPLSSVPSWSAALRPERRSLDGSRRVARPTILMYSTERKKLEKCSPGD